jgi:hypothetical protein
MMKYILLVAKDNALNIRDAQQRDWSRGKYKENYYPRMGLRGSPEG